MAIPQLPTIPVVIGTALVDSINPCAIGVLVLLITTLLALSKNKRKMLMVGTIYIAAVFVTYLLAGFGLLFFIQKLNIAETLGMIVGGLVIVLGLIEVKDFWWYGQGFSLAIPASKVEKIKKYVKKATIPGAIFLGIFVSAVELPCTGGPYLAITTLLAKVGLTWKIFWLMAFYNFIFVLPLIVILLAVYFGADVSAIKKWKQGARKWMRLATGLIMIGLGILLILFAKGIIHFSISV